MRHLVGLLLSLMILGLFLYYRVLPHKQLLDPKYRRYFDFLDRIITPLTNGLQGIIKPVRLGAGLSIDMSQTLLLILLLIFLNMI